MTKQQIQVPPEGVFVPVPTFFQPATTPLSTTQPAVDVSTQVQHSIHLAKNGIHGLVLLGSTGEAIHLSRAERSELIAGVRNGLTNAGYVDYPIMAGVLTNSLNEALEWLADAKEAGAQWGLVLAPGYFGPAANQENIQEWYNIVADASPIPILTYHYPGVTNNITISLDTYAKLAAHPNIVGCKMSHGNVSHHLQVSLTPDIDHERFRVFSGFGQQLGPIVQFGAAGVIDGLAAIYPRTVVRLFELAKRRPVESTELQELLSLQFSISRAEEFVVKWGIIGIKEGIYRTLGFGNLEGGRLPLRGQLPQGEWQSWNFATKAMEKLESS